MARYIDADELIQKIEEGNKSLLTSALAMTVIKMIDDIPTADVVEVVRCKDCEHFNGETHGCIRNPSVEPWWEEDYCSYGERRKDERLN